LEKNPCLNCRTLRLKEVHTCISLVKNEVLVTYRRAGCWVWYEYDWWLRIWRVHVAFKYVTHFCSDQLAIHRTVR
jgi:hypothetical protein